MGDFKVDLKSRIIIASLALLAYLPMSWLQALGRFVGKVLVWTKSDLYLTARKNFELCYPEESAEQHHVRARRTLEQTGQTMLEAAPAWVRPLKRNRRYITSIEGEHFLKAAVAKGKGVMFIAPHIGNWEWLNTYLPQFCEIEVLYKSVELPGLDHFVANQRKRCGIKVWPGDSMGLRSYIRTFLKGGNIFILPDQEPAKGSGVFAPFMGMQALTPRIVGDLLRKNRDASALVVYALRSANGFSIHIEPADEGIYASDSGLSATALNRSIEKVVRKAPDQYQWGYKRFRIQPNDEISPYKKLKWQFKGRL